MKKEYDNSRKNYGAASASDETEELLDTLLREAFLEEAPELSEELIQRTLCAAEQGKQPVYGRMPLQRDKKLLRRRSTLARIAEIGALSAAAVLVLFVGGIALTGGQKEKSIAENTSGSVMETACEQAIKAPAELKDAITESGGMGFDDGMAWTGETDTTSENEVAAAGDEADGKIQTVSALYEALPYLADYEETKNAQALQYTLWIDDTVYEGAWEEAALDALTACAPKLSKEDFSTEEAENAEAGVVIVAEAENLYYALRLGSKAVLTIRTGSEEERFVFEISDLTPYEELFSMKP